MIVETSITAAEVTVKDTSFDPSVIARTIGDKVSRLRNDAVEWGHKLQELEADLTNSQNVDDTAKSVDGCLVVLRAAADRLAPNSETRTTLRKQEDAIRDLAIRAEVHSNQAIRKISDHFQQKAAELHAVNRSFEETRTRLVTEIDRLQELKIRLEFNHAAVHSGELLKEGEISVGNIQTLTADAQRLAGTLCDFGAAPVAHCTRPHEPATRKRASYPAFGAGLVAGTSYAPGQTHLPTFIAEAPVVAPPSGVLVTQPLAPVAVPLSGVLITQPTAANIQPSAARSGDPSHALLPESRKDDRVATGY